MLTARVVGRSGSVALGSLRPLWLSSWTGVGADQRVDSEEGKTVATRPTDVPIVPFVPFAPEGPRVLPRSQSGAKKHLVIIGTGWASYALLKSIDRSLYDVTVVSNRNHFLFTPLLASTTVGTLEFRSIIQPVRTKEFRDVDLHLSHVRGVDPSTNTILCEDVVAAEHKYRITYDKLVIGCGARTNTFGIPGVRENAFFLKEVAHARAIRSRIMDNIELAAHPGISEERRKQLLHVVVVGGGPTGVEFSAEVYDFLKEDVDRLYPKEAKDFRLSLIEGRSILGAFDEGFRKYALKKISGRSRMSLVTANVTRVDPESITVDDGRVFPCGIVVWSAGVMPNKLTRLVTQLPKCPKGNFLTNAQCQVKDHPNVFAIGDCASIEGAALPQTAQRAERQGMWLAKHLGRLAKGELSTNPGEGFVYVPQGMLAYIGAYTAVFQVGKEKGLSGVTSWIVWRSAYFTKLGSWRLRMQVPLDWFKTFFMGRDISRF